MEIQGDRIRRDAEFSADGVYRYRLSRVWGDGPRVTFVMLNPATGDGKEDDATLRRCIGYARKWGYSGLCAVNLYAFVTRYPAELWTVADPVGPENDRHLRAAAAGGGPLIAAWGARAKQDRVSEVLAFPGFDGLECLVANKGGSPRHPLYADARLNRTPWPI